MLWVKFKIAQDYYAAELCIQKEIEDNACQGQCQLKSILQGETRSLPQAPMLPEYSEEQLDLVQMDGGEALVFETSTDKIISIPYLNSTELAGYTGLNWKPPQV